MHGKERHVGTGIVAALALAAGAWVGADAAETPPAPVRAEPAPPPAGDAGAAKAKEAKPEAGNCHDRFLAIQVVHDAIPRKVRGLRGQRLREIQEAVDGLIRDAEAFRASCAAAPERPWVTYYLAHALMMNNVVWYSKLPSGLSAEEKRQRRQAYFRRVLDLCEEILAAKGIERRLRMLTDYLIGQIHDNTGENEKAAGQYEKFLATYPDYPDLEAVTFALARAHLRAEHFAKAETWGRRFLKRFGNSRFAPYAGDLLYKTFTGQGKLEEAIRYLQENEAIYRRMARRGGLPEAVREAYARYAAAAGLEGAHGTDPEEAKAEASIPEEGRQAYDMYADWAGFRIGWCLFALADYDRARDVLRTSREYLEKKKETVGLAPPTDVYLRRVQTILDVLQSLVQTPAPPWEPDWVTEERPTLKDCRGRAVILLFRSYEWTRPRPILTFLDGMYRDLGGPVGPLEVVTIAYYKGMRDVEGQRARVAAEVKRLGLTYGAGLDPSKDKSIFDAYKASVGSATLVVIDPFGQIVWYKEDPRPNDFGALRRVIERLTR